MSDPGGVKVVFIKKKNKGHGHHGGAWKVAYADFVTAMMALFIVLWLLTQSDQASKEQIAEYFRTGTMPGGSLMVGKPGGNTPPKPVNVFPDGQGQMNAAAATESRELMKIAKSVEKMIQKAAASSPSLKNLGKHVRVKVVADGALIELVEGGDNFLFNVASSELKSGAIEILEQLAPMLAGLENKIEIHGHTDARPFGSGSKKTNWELSFERGDQARRVLENKGVEKGKIQSVLAHADTALFNTDNPLAPENRRLSLLIVRQSAQRTRAGLASEGEGARKKAVADDDEDLPKRRVEDDEDEPKRKPVDEEEDPPKKIKVIEDSELPPKRSKAEPASTGSKLESDLQDLKKRTSKKKH